MANNAVTQDLGAVSAYALAVEQGYKGTEEQWAMEQAECGNNARKAMGAAADAERYSKQAENSARDAESYAREINAHTGEATAAANAAQKALEDTTTVAQTAESTLQHYVGDSGKNAQLAAEHESGARSAASRANAYANEAKKASDDSVSRLNAAQEAADAAARSQGKASDSELASETAASNALKSQTSALEHATKAEEAALAARQTAEAITPEILEATNNANKAAEEASRVNIQTTQTPTGVEIVTTDRDGIEVTTVLDTVVQLKTWEDVRSVVRRGNAKKLLRPGDVFNAVWTDPVSKKTYEVPWHIADIQNVITPKRETVEAALIQQHRVLPEETMFDSWEAFYAAKETPLPPGTYHIVIKDNWGDHYKAGEAWSFTTTREVPVGGVLAGLRDSYSADLSTAKVDVIKSLLEPEPLETVSLRPGAEGTKLGEYSAAGGNGLNSMQRVCYGYNNYKHSYIRQKLNSSGQGFWKPQNEYDLPYSGYKEDYGFMTGWDPLFLSVCQPFLSVIGRNNVTDGGGQDEVFDRFILPSLEQMYIKNQAGGEGPVLQYWKDALGIPEPREWYKDTPELVHLDINGTKRHVRLRSAVVGYGNNAWCVSPSGFVSNYNARSRCASAPLAAIY